MANILIFEDDLILAESWQEILIAEGHQVEHTANLDTAMNLVREGEIELAFIDIIIRDSVQQISQSGNNLISYIQTLILDHKPWLIAVSGRPHDPSLSVLDIAQQLGADEYLEKPFDLQELVAVVNRVVKAQANEH